MSFSDNEFWYSLAGLEIEGVEFVVGGKNPPKALLKPFILSWEKSKKNNIYKN